MGQSNGQLHAVTKDTRIDTLFEAIAQINLDMSRMRESINQTIVNLNGHGNFVNAKFKEFGAAIGHLQANVFPELMEQAKAAQQAASNGTPLNNQTNTENNNGEEGTEECCDSGRGCGGSEDHAA